VEGSSTLEGAIAYLTFLTFGNKYGNMWPPWVATLASPVGAKVPNRWGKSGTAEMQE